VTSNSNGQGHAPDVSVVVSTRNRENDILPCVQSILASDHGSFELVVVDQSDSNTSRSAVMASVSDSRLHWIKTSTRGLSISRNIAVENVRAPLIVFTDDDCRVPTDWVASVERVFRDDPDAALVFGRVQKGAGADDGGFAAEFEPPPRAFYQNEFPSVTEAWGIGANMALRRSTLDLTGPFDPSLGAGARFRGGEDADIMIRVLGAGLKVVFTQETTVTHLGVRAGEDASKLMRGYGIGMGATLAKHLRLGTRGGRKLFSDWVSIQGRRALENALRGVHPSGLGLVAFSVWGAAKSCMLRVDSRRAVYDE